ncbi:hypothetical protein [Algibacillus agarilyticus]|uniref:hypothetical protein n=1 Tax=Algibacillus agarilyticus TaxID=2234133 RepID=UPI000DD09132|nr:hypothetical protein [Algibacillus agarilyticus]
MALIFRLIKTRLLWLKLAIGTLLIIVLQACQLTAQQSVVLSLEERNYLASVAKLKKQKADFSIAEMSHLRVLYNETGREMQNFQLLYQQTPLVFQALNAKDYTGCIRYAESILDINYTHLTAHFGAMNCYNSIQNQDKSQYHAAILSNLMDSITDKLNGRTVDLAFNAYSFDDIQSLIHLLGLNIRGRDLINIDDQHFDKIAVTEVDTQENFDLYFNVTPILKWAEIYR